MFCVVVMKLSEMIPYIGKGREEETMKLIKEHVEITYKIVLELRNAVSYTHLTLPTN